MRGLAAAVLASLLPERQVAIHMAERRLPPGEEAAGRVSKASPNLATINHQYALVHHGLMPAGS